MIGAATKSTCPVCGASASLLEGAMTDVYFGYEGAWDYFQCEEAGCRTAFPDPPISDADLTAAYGRYYTHEDGGYSALTRIRDRLVAGLLPSEMSNKPTAPERIPVLDFLYEQLAWSLGGRRGLPRGSIVDVGCGNGDRLARFQAIGWGRAVGVEFDEQAVRIAQAEGRAVRQGTAERSPEGDASHDLVFMHHVIEHVRDPAAAFAEAWRVLKPGGQLFILTPNIDSALRRETGPRWRGFEAPRHLMIFTVPGLERLASGAGFDIVTCRTTGRSAGWMRAISLGEAPRGAVARLIRGYALYRAQKADISRGRQVGDEIILVDRKPAGVPVAG